MIAWYSLSKRLRSFLDAPISSSAARSLARLKSAPKNIQESKSGSDTALPLVAINKGNKKSRNFSSMELKFRDFLFPLFIATSGRAVSLPLFDSWMFLGADLSRARLRAALELIGASKKERKRLDKEYQAIKAAIDSAPAPT